MDNVNALNSAPSPFNPRPQMTKEQHRRFRTGAVVLAVIAFIIGVAYLWWMINKQEPVMQTQVTNVAKQERAAEIQRLDQYTSQQDPVSVKKAIDRLNKSSYVPSASEKAAAIDRLNSSQ